MDSSTLCRMRIDARLAGLGLGLVGLGFTAMACAPPCYDDGVLQTGCPVEAETEVASASGTDTDPSTTTNATADGTADSGIMTADGTGSDSLDSSSSDGGPMCPGFQALLTPETRTFEFVVEQSGAMAFDFDGVSRYAAVAEVLFHPMDGVVTQLESDVRFGMLVYHGLQAGCPITDAVAPQNDASVPLSGLMAANPPTGSNPVPDSIDEGVMELSADAAAGDKTLVLILGNEPGSCDIQTPVNAIDLAETRGATLSSITMAESMGFQTRVINMGGTVSPVFLQLAANAGAGVGGPDPDAPYWVVQDRAELTAAMEEITATSRPCDFSLDAPVSAELAPNCEVVVNGGVVMYEDPDGWDLPDDQTLQLSGMACDSIQQGLATINMTCSCDA